MASSSSGELAMVCHVRCTDWTTEKMEAEMTKTKAILASIGLFLVVGLTGPLVVLLLFTIFGSTLLLGWQIVLSLVIGWIATVLAFLFFTKI